MSNQQHEVVPNWLGNGSIRLDLIAKIAAYSDQFGFEIPAFTVFPTDILDRSFSDEELIHITSQLHDHRLFVKGFPREESAFPNLSFAGLSTSAIGQRYQSRLEQVRQGLQIVAKRKQSEYARYYRGRHRITSEHGYIVTCTEGIRLAQRVGTIYIYQNLGMLEAYDDVMSLRLRDPEKYFFDIGGSLPRQYRKLIGISAKISDLINNAVDIEFVIDWKENVHIVQVRPLSSAHLHNWQKMSLGLTHCLTKSDANLPIVVNSVGTTCGLVVDLRTRKVCASDLCDVNGKVFVVNHKSDLGTDSLAFLYQLSKVSESSICLVVDHGSRRTLDHLQYAVVEDPKLRYIFQISGQVGFELADGAKVEVTSDGLNLAIRQLSA